MVEIADFKIQKLSKKQHGVHGKTGLLCMLPDVILQHILSFLPIADAVRTSVLSTRWEYLWTSIPNLVFNGYKGDRTTYMDFVDRAISFRNFDIKQFNLVTDVGADAVRIKRWISVAAWRNVQSLSIITTVNCNGALQLPRSLFTCASLSELELSLSVSFTLKLPSSICFSNLKILGLYDITFPNDHCTQNLFSGCLLLEELTLYECNWRKVNSLNICCPKLLDLSINDMNVDFDIWDESHGCQISIFGCCLERFYYFGDLLNDYVLYDSSLLDEVWVSVYYWTRRARIVANRLYKLLNGLCDAKQLILSPYCIEVLQFAPEVLAHLPLLKNLSTLELNMDPVDLYQEGLLRILEKSPCLESLSFTGGIEVSSGRELVKGLLKPTPSCFSSRLTEIYISSYDMIDKQLCKDVVEMFLTRAAVLRRLDVNYRPESIWSEEESKDFIEEILQLPRASEVVEISVHTT